MNKYFTVDRLGNYKPGTNITGQSIEQFAGNMPAELVETMKLNFPEGLNGLELQYGLWAHPLLTRIETEEAEYFVNGKQRDAITELFYELYRKAHFPRSPSRMSCVYGTVDLDEAREFRRNYGQPTQNIYEVHSQLPGHTGDMNGLLISIPFSSILRNADLYWRGQQVTNEQPFWETLIPFPAEVIRIVDAGKREMIARGAVMDAFRTIMLRYAARRNSDK